MMCSSRDTRSAASSAKWCPAESSSVPVSTSRSTSTTCPPSHPPHSCSRPGERQRAIRDWPITCTVFCGGLTRFAAPPRAGARGGHLRGGAGRGGGVELGGGGGVLGRAERLDADGRLVVINRENGNAQVVAAGDVT